MGLKVSLGISFVCIRSAGHFVKFHCIFEALSLFSAGATQAQS